VLDPLTAWRPAAGPRRRLTPRRISGAPLSALGTAQSSGTCRNEASISPPDQASPSSALARRAKATSGGRAARQGRCQARGLFEHGVDGREAVRHGGPERGGHHVCDAGGLATQEVACRPWRRPVSSQNAIHVPRGLEGAPPRVGPHLAPAVERQVVDEVVGIIDDLQGQRVAGRCGGRQVQGLSQMEEDRGHLRNKDRRSHGVAFAAAAAVAAGCLMEGIEGALRVITLGGLVAERVGPALP